MSLARGTIYSPAMDTSQRTYIFSNELQNNNCRPSSSNGQHQIHANRTDRNLWHNSPDNQDEEEEAPDAEEIYVFNCCGTSGEAPTTWGAMMPTLRVLFTLFNAFVIALGFACLGMGLWFRIDPKVYEIHKYLETQNYTIAGWIMLFAGFTAIIVSLIVGLIWFKRQSSASTLIVHCIVMTCLTLALIGALVLLSVHGLGMSLERFFAKEVSNQILRRAMNTEMDQFVSNDASLFIDFLQVKMRCCGAESFKDYAKLGMVVPTTCYTIDRNYINAPGCGRAARRLFDIRAGMAIGFTAAAIVVQMIAIALSGLILCSILNGSGARDQVRLHRARLARVHPPTELRFASPHEQPGSRVPIVL